MARFTFSAFADEIAPALDRQMDVLDRYAIRYIELRTADGIPVAEFTTKEARLARRRMADRGFAVSALGSPIGKVDVREPFAPHLDLFKHVLELADAFETRYIRLFSFFVPPGEDPDAYRGPVIERMAAFEDAARGSGITLLHENEKEIYGDTPERCLDILRSVNSPALRGAYDFSNFVQCGVVNYPHAWHMLRDDIVYFHLKDSLYSDDQTVRDLGLEVTGNAHRPVGQGDGNVFAILSEAAAAGFGGFVSIEPHLGKEYGETGEARFDAAARAALELVKKIIEQEGKQT